MDGDSNRVRKIHSHRLKSFAVGSRCRAEEDPVIRFGPMDLEEVTTPHEDAMVI